MASLTYRGIVYKKDVTAPKKEIVSDAPHVYRGKFYHYELSKKEEVS
tara:strand:+ start:360 stop:500 length:141 start_codon:yes stop_codon:yes gene_type:complete